MSLLLGLRLETSFYMDELMLYSVLSPTNDIVGYSIIDRSQCFVGVVLHIQCGGGVRVRSVGL